MYCVGVDWYAYIWIIALVRHLVVWALKCLNYFEVYDNSNVNIACVSCVWGEIYGLSLCVHCHGSYISRQDKWLQCLLCVISDFSRCEISAGLLEPVNR